MIGILGKKLGMTQFFDEQGNGIPVTVIEAGPCIVTAVRRQEKDGYNAVQLAFGEQKKKSLTKAKAGVYKKLGVEAKKYMREIRTDKAGELNVGDEIRADNFEAGEFVDVVGFSIGKGFQGVVKRHKFVGGPKSHGSMFGRVPGSIGASSFPSRVHKGMRAAGHMGAENVTQQNLKVIKVDAENNLIAVRGAVPGVEDGLVVILEALKRGKRKDWKKVERKEEKSEKGKAGKEEAAEKAETESGETKS